MGQRLAKKKARQFQDADALQEELREMGVEVDDRRRVWYMVQPNVEGEEGMGGGGGAYDDGLYEVDEKWRE